MKAKEPAVQVGGGSSEAPAEDTLTEKIFEAIGLSAADDSAYDLLIDRTEKNGEPSVVFRDDIAVYGKCWRLGSGLEIWTVLYDGPSEKYYADCRPGFRARYVQVLTPWELIEYCEDGEAIVRGRVRECTDVVLELQNFTEVSSRLLREPVLRVGLAGLAWNVRVDSAPAPETSAANFSPAAHTCEQAGENEYVIRGRILASSEIVNPVSRICVHWMFVDTGVIRIEILASLGSVDGVLGVGSWITADVWLQGHVLAEYEVAARYEGVDSDYQKGDFWGLLRRAN